MYRRTYRLAYLTKYSRVTGLVDSATAYILATFILVSLTIWRNPSSTPSITNQPLAIFASISGSPSSPRDEAPDCLGQAPFPSNDDELCPLLAQPVWRLL